MLSSKPVKSKYTVGDTVYHYFNGAIETLTIKKVIVNVTNPNDTTNGVQKNKYGFIENDRFYLEDDLYVKPNALLQSILFPEDNNQITDYLSHLIISGQYEGFTSAFVTRDLCGVNMEDSTVDEQENPDYTDCFVDYARFNNWAGTWISTRLGFIEDVASYDKRHTIWEDNLPISDLRGIPVISHIGSLKNDAASIDRMTGCLVDNCDFTGLAGSMTKAQFISIVSSYDHLTTIWKDGHPIIDCRNITFTGNISTLDLSDRFFEGADFTGCTMPANADTKLEFKALVGSWNAVTTIWTDGLPIGS